MAVQRSSRPALSRPLRLLVLAACLAPPFAWSQAQAPSTPPATACPLQPRYPLPADRSDLQKLATAQQAAADERGCLTNAAFHAWRGATLLALGRTAEAIEPLERALLHDPDLPGAQLDLAQALAAEGDTASARAFLAHMRQRSDLPLPIGQVIDRQLEILSLPTPLANVLTAGWQSRWQFSAMGGSETNLNNAPSSSEVTLTFPQGDVTLPLDVESRPRSGGATLGVVQWQGLRPWNESVLVVQAEFKARQTGDSETSYQQSDVAATWLDAPAASRQWVARVARSHLRYGGTSLLRATRATLQYQWEARERTEASPWSEVLAGCRPAASLELEHRGYPESRVLDGLYQGGAAGWLCRRSMVGRGIEALTANTFFYGAQARLGSDRPLQAARAGGAYRRAEVRAQWEGPWLGGRVGAQWSTTRQRDRTPYSPLLGNVPRSTTRHVLQLEASWPLTESLALVANAEISRQSSNLAVFDARQRSVYMGLRWEVMQ